MPLPETMYGVVLTGHGGPEALAWRDDLPVPQPAATDVIIEVAAAGVNNTDINTRHRLVFQGRQRCRGCGLDGEALTFPRIQGADVCGRIVAVGTDVDPGRIGERVLIEPSLVEADGRMLPMPWYFGSECDGASRNSPGWPRATRIRWPAI